MSRLLNFSLGKIAGIALATLFVFPTFSDAATKQNSAKTTKKATTATKSAKTANSTQWELIWADEFSGSKINSRRWTKITRGSPDWRKHMSSDPSLYAVKNGNLILRGKVNPNQKKDPVPFITGGISSEGKFSFKYGKVEIRAKFDSAKGAWPALWMLPDGPMKWPDDGEIDIMEHLNFDDFAYQTVHSHFTYTLKRTTPRNSVAGKIKRDDYNVYGVEWTPSRIVFFINGKETFTYPRIKAEAENKQWPFTRPYYLLIDMQLGGSWVGNVNPAQLPVEMHVDWVRVYRRKR